MNKLVLSLLLTAVFVVPAFSQMSMSMEEHQEGYGQIKEICTTDKMLGLCSEHPDKQALTDERIMKMKPADSEMKKKEARLTAELRIAEKENVEIIEVADFDLEKALQ